MNKDNTEKITYIIILAIVMYCCSIVVWGFARQMDTLKIEAVERGHAEWKIKSNGAVNWQWKELK
jgi:uncharacterized membrane protein